MSSGADDLEKRKEELVESITNGHIDLDERTQARLRRMREAIGSLEFQMRDIAMTVLETKGKKELTDYQLSNECDKLVLIEKE